MSRINRRSWWLSDEKNCAMSNTRVLIKRCLIYPAWIRWVSTILASIIEYCFKPSSWHEWIAFLETAWNWSLLLMTFSINLPSVFNNTVDLNVFRELYKALLGLEIIINNKNLKCDGQWPNLIHILAILIKLFKDRPLEPFFRELYPFHNQFAWNFF